MPTAKPPIDAKADEMRGALVKRDPYPVLVEQHATFELSLNVSARR
jgi:hypothetical protein